MLKAVRLCFARYFTFSGRARRPEYWWFVLFVFVGAVLFSLVDAALFGVSLADDDQTGPLAALFQIATFIPMLSAGFRRMHDTGRTGWLLFLPLGMSILMTMLIVTGFATFAGFAGPGAEADPNTVKSTALLVGLAAMAVAGIVFLVVLALMLFWLTRPTMPDANKYGAVPPLWGAEPAA